MIKKLFTFLWPWPIRRRLLHKWFGYNIAKDAKIGWSWIFPDQLIMESGSRIGHLNVAVHLDCVELKANAKIGRSNWITGFSTKAQSKHFEYQKNRQSKLYLGEHAAVTKQHHLDCTNVINIGEFATIAGYSSQFLTHSIDVYENRQSSAPITIGAYTFVSTNVVVLGGAVLPDFSVLGAKALLNKTFTEEWTLYGGVPAKAVRAIDKTAKYFSRPVGFVY
ncbi:acyltransferase [Tamlana sp. 62-3]|uniref:Acyltransferase n=1 Tax=Neotamlana sargassicola TaxID=2883125 RepID=A0A9X1I9H3_9FLAO|nr:acyltransferase [Tamlana sargassicola]MCB4809215.1 acyltransferase [Tamlana sargassicola]